MGKRRALDIVRAVQQNRDRFGVAAARGLVTLQRWLVLMLVFRPRARAGTVFVFLAFSACSGGPNLLPEERAVVRDSAGVSIVENRAPDPGSRLGWTVDDAPVLSIGAFDGSDGQDLFDVVAATRLEDGRILIANAGTSEIKVFSGSGTYLDTWGREGEGPGEFMDLADVGPWRSDSVAAWDRGVDRLTVFDLGGDPVRTVSLIEDRVGPAHPSGVFDDGAIVAASQIRFRAGEHQTGLVARSREYVLLGPDGELVTSYGAQRGREYYVAAGETFMAVLPHPFGRGTRSATWNERVAIGATHTYEIRGYDRNGSLATILRRDHERIPVRQTHVDRWVAEMLAQTDEAGRATLAEMSQDIPTVESFPAYSSIEGDPLGFLWVEEYALPDDDRVIWSVFDDRGRVMGFVETPTASQVLEIGAEHLLTLRTDELEVEYVELWSLLRSGH